MADLSEITLRSSLKIVVPVADFSLGGSHPVSVKIGSGYAWLTKEEVDAAEHIPAPRVFKRGDWVRRGTRRHGLVYRRDEVDRVWVSWPVTSGSETVESERISNLEPDEAPE